MNYGVLSRLLGILVLIMGGCMVFPALWGVYYGERETWAMASGIAACAVGGAALLALGRRSRAAVMTRRTGIAVVGLGWIAAAAFGCVPFVVAGTFPGAAGVIDAYFETMSGFTTTGSTVLVDIEAVPKCLLFWRSMTHWLGGMGIIVLFVALMPFLGVGARQLYRSEVPGPTHDGFTPKIRETARMLWLIYLGITALETFMLLGTGMGLFDSLCHTFGTMATGGFSTKNASIGHYGDLNVEIIVIFFMASVGVNFGLYYQVLRGGAGALPADTEFRAYTGLLLAGTCAVTINLYAAGVYGSVWSALRNASFQVTSILTTTGYGTANFNEWPPFSKTLLVVFMFIGGCAGSTGGGMKVIRAVVLAKSAFHSVYRTFHPEAQLTLRIGGAPIPEQTRVQIMEFFVWAFGIFAAASLVAAAFGCDVVTSVTAVAATLWNIGPGLERVGAIENYAFMHPFVKLILSLCMVMGRLELFTVLALFSPSFWKR
ncbi:MAG: potassium transporter TrkG [bacterium]